MAISLSKVRATQPLVVIDTLIQNRKSYWLNGPKPSKSSVSKQSMVKSLLMIFSSMARMFPELGCGPILEFITVLDSLHGIGKNTNAESLSHLVRLASQQPYSLYKKLHSTI